MVFQLPKDEDESMKYKVFVLPLRDSIRNDEHTFEGNPMLVIDIDLQELCCPSQFKKLGSDSNSGNINRKDLVRLKTQSSTCFKHRAIHTLLALGKNRKESLLDHLNVYSCQCYFTLCPNNIEEHSHLDFCSNIVKTNHSVACEDKA